MTRPLRSRALRGSIGVLLVLLLGIPVACVLTVKPNEWHPDRGPVVPHDSFPADCSLCHTSGDWQELREDFEFHHEQETGMPLVGAHTDVECLLCHNDRGPVQAFANRGCGGCHGDPHQRRLGGDCESCHNQESWVPRGMIARHNRTRFPLVGAHAAAPCFRCHIGAEVGNFQRADTRCESCHLDDLARALNPDHAAQGWVLDCQRCHAPTTWRDARFAHTAGFPLTGTHGAIPCESCHIGGSFSSLPTDCAACHLDEYNATTDPDHVSAGFPMNCEACHNTVTWAGAGFSHPFFPVSGDHGGLDCTDCHPAGGNFAIFTCIDCHAHEQGETDDEHDEVGGYVYASSACLNCHPTGQE
ncbi:MAG: hypothetical protein ACE5GW_08330 [Planctomycetota bacterium]